jgi:ParB/RepB/Spo0J family partition protein
MQDEFRDISIDEIVEPRLVLRSVNMMSADYLELRDSVAEHGFLNSICVRPALHAPGKYEVVDGNYRFHVARDLRRPTVPCLVKYDLTDDDVLAMQVQANAIRPETTPTEFARQLKRIMLHCRTVDGKDMTAAELAHVVKKRPSWLRNMLGLLTLTEAEQKAVNRSEIPITSAYMLAKIPKRFRPQFVDQAKTLPVNEFRPIAAAFIKQFMEAVRQGKLEAMFGDGGHFEPHAYVRKPRELESELKDRCCGALLTAAAGCTTPLDGWYLALEWVLHLDKESVEQQRTAAIERAQTHLLAAPPDADE